MSGSDPDVVFGPVLTTLMVGIHGAAQEGGVIRSETTRHPVLPLHPATRAGLIEVARRTDPLVLRWPR